MGTDKKGTQGAHKCSNLLTDEAKFFSQPDNPKHRQYEAQRAFYLEGEKWDKTKNVSQIIVVEIQARSEATEGTSMNKLMSHSMEIPSVASLLGMTLLKIPCFLVICQIKCGC